MNVEAAGLRDDVMKLWRLGSVEKMITDTIESLQLKHEPSGSAINTQAQWGHTHLNIQAIPYVSQTQRPHKNMLELPIDICSETEIYSI